MAFGYTKTLPAVTGVHANFPVTLRAFDFPATSIDGGASSILNGGGNLRAYTDDTKVTRLPVEIVRFVTGVSPDIEVHIKLPSAYTSATVYIEADDIETTQPATSNQYGRNAVWANGFNAVFHFEETSGDFVNSKGDGFDAAMPADTTGITRGATGVFSSGGCVDLDGYQGSISPISPEPGYWHDEVVASTVSAWAARGGPRSGPNPLLEEGGSTNGQSLYYRSTPQTMHYGVESNGAAVELDSSSTFIDDSQFFLIHGTYNAGAMSLYINGVEEASGVNSSSIPAHAGQPSIGDIELDAAVIGGSSASWDGKIDELRRANVARSAGWVSTEHSNQSAITSWGTNSAWADSAPAVDLGAVTAAVAASTEANPITQVHTLGQGYAIAATNASTNVLTQQHQLSTVEASAQANTNAQALTQTHRPGVVDIAATAAVSVAPLSQGNINLGEVNTAASADITPGALNQAHQLGATEVIAQANAQAQAFAQVHQLTSPPAYSDGVTTVGPLIQAQTLGALNVAANSAFYVEAITFGSLGDITNTSLVNCTARRHVTDQTYKRAVVSQTPQRSLRVN